SRLSWSISILRSCGINSRTVTLLSNSRPAIMRSPKFGESARRRRQDALLDVDEAEIVRIGLAVGDADEHRVAQAAERAATFHPIGGIQHFDPVVVATALERRDELAGAVAFQQLFERFSLRLRERPESLPERDRGLYVLDPLLSQLPPLAVNRAV